MRNVAKTIVYFHGYGSSAKSDKVELLKAVKDSEVFAYDINIDPSISLKELSDQIDLMLLDHPHENTEIVFVGTSLGAWYAAELAYVYGVKAVLINPCFEPQKSLAKYGVKQEILNKYRNIKLTTDMIVFIALDDEVLDYTEFCKNTNIEEVHFVPFAGHRFNGEAFQEVIERINNI